jgi:hypothetical protein
LASAAAVAVFQPYNAVKQFDAEPLAAQGHAR